MTKTLTTERLREILERRSPSLRWGEAEKIAAELLANREAQPVAGGSLECEDELNAALRLHRLKVEGHSQLSDSFRAGFKYARRTAPPATAVPDDYFGRLVEKARVSADKAMRKFPQPNYVLNKVAEESGEVIKAVIHYTEGREEWANVEGEIIDNLAMLIRLVVEGDQIIGFTPPDACRAAMLVQPVSQGCKLVPVEPTEEMIAAAMNCDDVEFNSDETFCVNFDNIYRAMLAAAPEGGNDPDTRR